MKCRTRKLAYKTEKIQETQTGFETSQMFIKWRKYEPKIGLAVKCMFIYIYMDLYTVEGSHVLFCANGLIVFFMALCVCVDLFSPCFEQISAACGALMAGTNT